MVALVVLWETVVMEIVVVVVFDVAILVLLEETIATILGRW